MLEVTHLKNGTTFELNGSPYKVVKYRHQKIGRGGANVIVSVRNLKTGNLEEKTFNSSSKVKSIQTIKRPLQYLYADLGGVYFLDPATYEQVEITRDVLSDVLDFMKEGEEVDVLFWDDAAISVDIPDKVILKVVETDPGVKGNSASNMYKQAVLENGVSVRVPLFIKTGELVKIDTRTKEYVERAVKGSAKG